jgi:hypothetical protein
MPKSNAEELRILSRRAKVATLLLRGETNHYDITRQLGMEESQRSTISRDITAIKAQWRQSSLRDFDEARGRELEKLELLEKEAWEAWERSKQERESSRAKRRFKPPPPPAEGQQPAPASEEASETELTKEKRDGTPAFLEVVLKCISKRCEILGLNAPQKIAPTTPDGNSPWTLPLKDLSDDELAVVEKLAQRMQSIAAGEAKEN